MREMVFHKFQKIDGLEKCAEEILCHNVVVTEKIHGTSFRFVIFNPKLNKEPRFGSRNREVDGHDDTFYGAQPQRWVLDKLQQNKSYFDAIWSDDLEYVAFYGEWAGDGVMGEVKYGPANFYCYQVRRGFRPSYVIREEILLYREMRNLCGNLGLTCVPLICSGMLSLDFLKGILKMDSFVLKIPNNQLEGVVITVEPHMFDEDHDLYMVKFKNERFKEHNKPVKEKQIKSPAGTLLAEEFVTKGRILNIISHADFTPAWDMMDMKYLSTLVPADIKEEEGEAWEKGLKEVSEADIRSAICRKTVSLYKEILLDRGLSK